METFWEWFKTTALSGCFVWIISRFKLGNKKSEGVLLNRCDSGRDGHIENSVAVNQARDVNVNYATPLQLPQLTPSQEGVLRFLQEEGRCNLRRMLSDGDQLKAIRSKTVFGMFGSADLFDTIKQLEDLHLAVTEGEKQNQIVRATAHGNGFKITTLSEGGDINV
jgi:hypothetical protein